MKRQIITINEELCNGCGQCVSACSEGALQLVNGKARLVKEDFCDGLGDCMGECPTGALKIEIREVADYDPVATRRHVEQTRGAEGLAQFDQAAQAHAKIQHADAAPAQHSAPSGGCPGLRMRFAPKTDGAAPAAPVKTDGLAGQAIRSDLEQWPVQIHLVNPAAPYFKNRELVVLSTCAPVASADIHWRFIRGRAVVVGCPKLDRTEGYVEKLAAILKEPSIPRVLVVRMTVPCCSGLTTMVRQAVAATGRAELIMDEISVDLDGSILS